MPKQSDSTIDTTSPTFDVQQSDKKEFVRNFLLSPQQFSGSNGDKHVELGAIEHQLYQLVGLLITKPDEVLNNDLTLEHLFQTSSEGQNSFQFNGNVLPDFVQNLVTLLDRLFHSLVTDSNLEAQIKRPLNRLRLPYLLLFINDPKLLLQKHQPTRQLINDMISVGQLWDPQDPKSDQLLLQIETTVEQILQSSTDGQLLQSQIGDIVAQFHQFAQSVVKRAEIFEKRIREAEEGQAKALVAKRTTRRILAQITCKQGVPDFILRMLNKAWQHVIFLELLKTDEPQEIPGLFIAKALLVSLQPLKNIEETEKFLELQPVLLEKIKANLEKTSYSHIETRAFIEELDALHNEILLDARSVLEKGPTEEILRLKPTTSVFDVSPPSAQQEIDTPPDFESLDVNQWVEFVFSQMHEVQNDNQLLEEQGQSRQEKDQQASARIINLLKPGRWVTLTEDDSSSRCKLSTYIESNDKFIFVSGSGNKVAEFSTESLVQAFQKKQVSLLENAPLFERTFKSVLNDLFIQHQAQRLEQEAATEKKANQTLPVSQKPQQMHTPESNAKQTPQVLSGSASHDLKIDTQSVAANNTESQINSASLNAKTETSSPHSTEPTDDRPIAEDLAHLSHLAVGSWLEIKIGYKLTKCRLAAKIASTGKHIFTDRSGVKVKECFAEDLIGLFKKGELILDEEHSFYDKAFTSVISNLRNLKAGKSS